MVGAACQSSRLLPKLSYFFLTLQRNLTLHLVYVVSAAFSSDIIPPSMRAPISFSVV